MILETKGYAYNDLTLVPKVISRVKSRNQCNPFIDNKLPIFTAPMASVVSDKNYKKFKDNGIMPIIPRNIDLEIRKEMMEYSWVALSLNEFKDLFIKNSSERQQEKIYHICVDIANGHMKSLYELCALAKDFAMKYNYILVIMTGNIANPDTYKWICEFNNDNNYKIIDYIRVGIGGGQGCITTSNVSIHYPQASLIDECYKYKKYYLNYTHKDICPKIIADGGIRNYDHVIKALALGADYVMIGSLFAQCLESAGEKSCNLSIYKDFKFKDNYWYAYYTDDYKNELAQIPLKESWQTNEMNQYIRSINDEQNLGPITVKFFGMASADGQKSICGAKVKTAEGITKYLQVEFTLSGWVENMISYLRSAMSYCDSFTLQDFIGRQKLIPNSISEINAVNK